MMQRLFLACAVLALLASTRRVATAQTPENLVAENIPPAPPELKSDAGRYLEFRAAAFQGWHPIRREALITTRFAEANQLHLVRVPGGARRQLTFLPEPVAGGTFQPVSGDSIVFSQDTGGGEFFQLYRYNLADGRITLLTDGKSRNTGAHWSKAGDRIAFASTKRNGRDTDLYTLEVSNPATVKLALQVQGGGWSVLDWSPDGHSLLVGEYVSINESYVHLLDLDSGKLSDLTPRASSKGSTPKAKFTPDGRAVLVTSDRFGEFLQLGRVDLKSRAWVPLTATIPHDIEDFEPSPDGKWVAAVVNEDGSSTLRLLPLARQAERRLDSLPLGVISGLDWHPKTLELGFTLSSAKSPSDVYSYDTRSQKLARWTESETGGLDASRFSEPTLVKVRAADGLSVSGFLYRPNPARFPGKRPVLILIHGGPESQSRAGFLARNNYFVDELGVALLFPNVRGSSGYGKTFLTLDNGVKREDSVRDIGSFLDWIANDPALDSAKLAVMGGSYGGYMTLACLVHYSARLRCGIDIVGISNFVSFLQNTQDYRRDLRRAEYGDERDPATRKVLEEISPANRADRIRIPLMVVQGKNDPRVPLSEAEQMVKAIRNQGGTVWYLMAKDEGHGFAKKRNQDFQFLSTIQFLRAHLLNDAPARQP